jgi:hypothetical protein
MFCTLKYRASFIRTHRKSGRGLIFQRYKNNYVK